jgi:hypothetical protein
VNSDCKKGRFVVDANKGILRLGLLLMGARKGYVLPLLLVGVLATAAAAAA